MIAHDGPLAGAPCQLPLCILPAIHQLLSTALALASTCSVALEPASQVQWQRKENQITFQKPTIEYRGCDGLLPHVQVRNGLELERCLCGCFSKRKEKGVCVGGSERALCWEVQYRQ